MDDRGDPGKDVSSGATPYFGMALISASRKNYTSIRRLLAQVHWLCGIATPIDVKGGESYRALNLLRGLKELEENGLISASSIYITKASYEGRYLTWSDYDILPNSWPYFLRNYILRHLLEFHFCSEEVLNDPVDLVLDRNVLNEEQLRNTYNYLNSKISPPLLKPFAIPPIQHITLVDSEYVGGIEVTHVLAEMLRRRIQNNITPLMLDLSCFMKVLHFEGEGKNSQ